MSSMRQRSTGNSWSITIVDVPDESVNRFGVVTGYDDFDPISNFKIDIVVEVKAGKESGFLCEVAIHNPLNPEEPSFRG